MINYIKKTIKKRLNKRYTINGNKLKNKEIYRFLNVLEIIEILLMMNKNSWQNKFNYF